MRHVLAMAAAYLLLGTAAVAQTTTDQTTSGQTTGPSQSMPAQNEPNNAAVKSAHENNAAYPVAGANSFTKAQAKSALEAKGYTNVMGLKKDKSGVWRGTAMKDGQSGPVSVDYQGNVN